VFVDRRIDHEPTDGAFPRSDFARDRGDVGACSVEVREQIALIVAVEKFVHERVAFAYALKCVGDLFSCGAEGSNGIDEFGAVDELMYASIAALNLAQNRLDALGCPADRSRRLFELAYGARHRVGERGIFEEPLHGAVALGPAFADGGE